MVQFHLDMIWKDYLIPDTVTRSRDRYSEDSQRHSGLHHSKMEGNLEQSRLFPGLAVCDCGLSSLKATESWSLDLF